MHYEKPKFTLNQVDHAGRCLVAKDAELESRLHALDVLTNWRAAHNFPLNSLYTTLRDRAKKIDPQSLSAQRLKRYESIFIKLHRLPKLQLSQMQDIGGCRVILISIKQLDQLVDIYKKRKLQHIAQNEKDYINYPKEDGYRRIHLMYRVSGKSTSLPWNRLRIELQLKIKLQHSWATAVETVDTFNSDSLKLGGGSVDWRRFFQLVGSVHAAMENTARVQETPENESDIRTEIMDIENKLQIFSLLNSWSHLTQHVMGIRGGQNYWYLIEVRPIKHEVHIETFPALKMDEAKKRYGEMEQQNKSSSNNVVLVSVNSLSNLPKTYPNYFADTNDFISTLKRFLG